MCIRDRLIRFMQVLGAYGFRGLIQRKPHFIASTGNGIDNLYDFSETWEEMNDFPELKKIIKELKSSEVTPISYTHLDVYKRQNQFRIYRKPSSKNGKLKNIS